MISKAWDPWSSQSTVFMHKSESEGEIYDNILFQKDQQTSLAV